MMSISKCGLLAATSLAGVTILTTPAFAQTQTLDANDPEVEQPLPSANPPERGGLNEIVVTARKREESVQDVPVAVTAISDERWASVKRRVSAESSLHP